MRLSCCPHEYNHQGVDHKLDMFYFFFHNATDNVHVTSCTMLIQQVNVTTAACFCCCRPVNSRKKSLFLFEQHKPTADALIRAESCSPSKKSIKITAVLCEEVNAFKTASSVNIILVQQQHHALAGAGLNRAWASDRRMRKSVTLSDRTFGGVLLHVLLMVFSKCSVC